MAMRYPFRTKSASSTTGTGTYTLSEPNALGWRTLTQAVAAGDLANGDSVAYIAVDPTADVSLGGKVLEMGIGVWDNTAKTLTRTTVLQPAGTPVNWGAGTRDIVIVESPTLMLLAASNLSDLASAVTARTNLGLGTAAVLNVGTGANNIPQLNGSSQYPAVDGSLITNLNIPQVKRAAVDQGFTTATLANVTSFTFNVSAGVTYAFLVRLYLNTTGTGGFKAAFGGTCTATDFRAHGSLIKETATQFLATQQVNALTTVMLQVASAVDDDYMEIAGTITVNAGGTFLLQFAENTANGTTTIRRGSTFELQVVP